LCQLGCQLGWGSSTPTYNVNKLQYKAKVQKKKKTNKNLVELSNHQQSNRLNGGQKNLPQNTPVEKKCAGNLGRNQGSSSKRFEAHPTRALQK